MKLVGSPQIPIIGVAGWKKSGKTTLVTRLIAEFTARGLKVATVKHAHHDFQIDAGETDSARHRRAGAGQVAVVSSKRWAIINELDGASEPTLDEVITWLGPCDLIIAEGYKAAAIPKIEVRRSDAVSQEALAGVQPNVRAIAADYSIDDNDLPVFALDDITGIADFIATAVGVTTPGAAARTMPHR
jgi:molybdopterin-guanine dinucleotide biosynthesis adapter protein